MTEALDDTPYDPDAPLPEAPVDAKLGSRMLEIDSYERIIDGLRIAADGARNAACHKHGPLWNQMADIFDKMRAATSRLASLGRPSDSEPTKVILGGQFLPIVTSYIRVYDGLKMAAAASRQMASYHRQDLQWSYFAMQFDELQKRCSVLVRMREHVQSSQLIV